MTHSAENDAEAAARTLYCGPEPWESLAPSFRAMLIGMTEDARVIPPGATP